MASEADGLTAVAELASPRRVRDKDWAVACSALRAEEDIIGVIAASEWNGQQAPEVWYTGFITSQRIVLYRRRSLSYGPKTFWEAQLSELMSVRVERAKGPHGTYDVTQIKTVSGTGIVLRNDPPGAVYEAYDAGDFARSMTRLIAKVSVAPGAGQTVGEQLQQVAQLHADGALDDIEFAEAKRRLIASL